MDNIAPSKGPNIRLSPADYDKQYFDMMTNQLRLYFTQVDNANAALIQTAYSASVMNWLSEGSF
jgi:hypothetical protein